MKPTHLPIIFLIAATGWPCLEPLCAAEIKGSVRAVAEQIATIATEGDLVPNVGDKADIFFTLPGSEDEIAVATGKVLKVEGNSVQVKIENATGDVAKEQLVRITSEKPQPGSPGAASSSPAAAAPPAVAPATAPSATPTPSSAASPASPLAPLVGRWEYARGAPEVLSALVIRSDGTVMLLPPKKDEAELRGVTMKGKAVVVEAGPPLKFELSDFQLVPPPTLSEEEEKTFKERIAADAQAAKTMSEGVMFGEIETPTRLWLNQADNRSKIPSPRVAGAQAVWLTRSSAPAGAAPGGASTAAIISDPSFAFVNLNNVFRDYSKTKDAEAKINTAKEAAKKEFDERTATYRALLDEINALNKKLESSSPGSASTTPMANERDAKITAAKEMETELNSFRTTREMDLQEQALKMRQTLVDEITTMVKAMAGTVNLAIDHSGMSQNGVPLAVFAPAQADMTARVSTALAANQPGAAFEGMRNLQLAQVDMNRIFKELNRTKKAEAQINAKKNAVKAEYDRRAGSYTKLHASVSAMPEGKQREKGAAKLRAQEQEINQWRAKKEKELQDEALKLREGIVKTMTDAIGAKLTGHSSALILDTSGLSKHGNPIFVWTSGIPDFSDDVIAALNSPGGKTKTTAALLSSANLKFGCLDLARAMDSLPEAKQSEQEMNALAQEAQKELAAADLATQQAKQKELQNLSSQKLAPIVAKIRKQVGQTASAAGYNLIINSAAHSLNETPWLIASQDVSDITDQVITALENAR